MIDDNENNFGKYVYGNTIMDISREVLEGKEEILEEDYFKLINEYFNEIKQNKSQRVSNGLINAIEKLDFSEGEYSVDKFSLIQNNPGYIDVFLYMMIEQKLHMKFFLNLSSIKDFNKKKRTIFEDSKGYERLHIIYS